MRGWWAQGKGDSTCWLALTLVFECFLFVCFYLRVPVDILRPEWVYRMKSLNRSVFVWSEFCSTNIEGFVCVRGRGGRVRLEGREQVASNVGGYTLTPAYISRAVPVLLIDVILRAGGLRGVQRMDAELSVQHLAREASAVDASSWTDDDAAFFRCLSPSSNDENEFGETECAGKWTVYCVVIDSPQHQRNNFETGAPSVSSSFEQKLSIPAFSDIRLFEVSLLKN
ncbi:hypothetical protein BJ741DRAFT_99207 [Chytriomyces cf. hyalinus JEL632]|nr:hypothetical protein BJ741DRAFT_99207 [Chytriomyces cf. hyalinus JEL632]